MKKYVTNRRGSHAVEFALLFPVFVTFVFGGIDYFWYLLQRYELADAVVTGCRTDGMWLLECSAEIVYMPLVGMIPTPSLLTAESVQPVRIPEVDDTGH